MKVRRSGALLACRTRTIRMCLLDGRTRPTLTLPSGALMSCALDSIDRQ